MRRPQVASVIYIKNSLSSRKMNIDVNGLKVVTVKEKRETGLLEEYWLN